MADNVPITAGSGTTVSTEEVTTLNGGAVSAQHVQRVAAAVRTADGTAVDLPGTTADGLLVNLGANNDVTVTGTVTVGSHAVTNAGTFAVQAAQSGTWNVGTVTTVSAVTAISNALPAGTNNIGDVDVLSIAAGDNNIGNVDIVTMPNVTLAATTNTIEVVGDVAHDAAVGGNPVLIAARANANEPTAVSADGDATHLWADLFGRLVVIPGHPNPEAPVTLNATSSGNTTVIAAPGASLSLYICKASVHNRDRANVVVTLQDGAGGTSRWRAELAAEGGGALIDFGARGWKLTANTLLNVNLGGAGSVDVNITAYYIAA
jgi:hypothetical protein